MLCCFVSVRLALCICLRFLCQFLCSIHHENDHNFSIFNMSNIFGTIFDIELSDVTTNRRSRDECAERIVQTLDSPRGHSVQEAQYAAWPNDDPSTSSQELSAPRMASRAICVACGIGTGLAPPFSSFEEQRAHWRTDWHRYNMKRRDAGLKPVKESEFEAIIESHCDADEIGSLSGSDESGPEVSEEYSLMHGFSIESDQQGTQESMRRSPKSPYYVFTLDHKVRLGIWKEVVLQDTIPSREEAAANASDEDDTALAALANLQREGTRWAIIMISGGHFAARIYDVVPPSSKAKNSRGGAQEVSSKSWDDSSVLKEIVSKSFHRYVVRAKSGGKQSSKDATGKYARSAGSQLRRYNEVQLQNEVLETLKSWDGQLKSCRAIFVVAPSSNSKLIFGSNSSQSVLAKNDFRIRKVPFPTRRPTLSEVRRIARLLLSVFTLPRISEEDASTQEEATKGPEYTRDYVEHGPEQQPGDRECWSDGSQILHVDNSGDRIDENIEEASMKVHGDHGAKKSGKKSRKKRRQKAERLKATSASDDAGANDTATDHTPNDRDDATIDIDKEIANAVLQARSFVSRRNDPQSNNDGSRGTAKASRSSVAPRLSSRPHPNEDAATRRARLADAAEARMKALRLASAEQKLYS